MTLRKMFVIFALCNCVVNLKRSLGLVVVKLLNGFIQPELKISTDAFPATSGTGLI